MNAYPEGMTKSRALLIASTALFASVALAGCSASTTATQTPASSKTEVAADASSTKFSGADIMFAQMMIIHHQQAVDMGTLAETRSSSQEVKTLAAQIKAEQAPEIAQMEGWLKASNVNPGMGHDMAMTGMLTDAEMTALKNAKGAEFDRLYLADMIGHHKGAIQMAQMVVDSQNVEANKLGHAIIESQTKQITDMESLLAKK